MHFKDDRIVFTPSDIDLAYSPLQLSEPTYVLGAFNPALARLQNGNLVLMVRVAEALRAPVREGAVRAIRWTDAGYKLDSYPLDAVDRTDPRTIGLRANAHRTMALTSLSWLVPVELTANGDRIVSVHYDKIVSPARAYQEYGVEDPRISLIEDVYYMTVCSVAAARQGACLYTSRDGLNYALQGLVLDHQNKDMALFEGRIGGAFQALTRPLGADYFTYPPDAPWVAGPSIKLAVSPDARHWRPREETFLALRKGAAADARLGAGAPPILTSKGWLMLYHGVTGCEGPGVYHTFWALLDARDPARIVGLHDETALLEARAELTAPLADARYLRDIVFTTGIVDAGDHFIVASGADDLACRLTRIPRSTFDL